MLNPAPARAIDLAGFALIDLLTPNETELRLIQVSPPDDPTPSEELAQALIAQGARRIVVTRGKLGALIVTHEQMQTVAAPQISAIDVTGAGDSFNAAVAVGVARGLSLEDTVGQATFAGAYTALHLGCDQWASHK